ncbi:Predicted flavoprotein CzcO associated with the cation diffusion facilitator CzcD [Micromonospora nigra]|uniref:Predicted flavoprotein CzcO associated with the cation diffusion facilitator CzcD n=1 Tax=Micromonospora nigra TaxID=145857 RepID=A0A1C6RD07_9ACTN|nr:FAD-dependent oxidoreductase [Micromonospora nigra]SCL14989.1 Predicted flavoprotein CzcO associated with the cation diffusion facilitator CzcD [Micromonospora nigra]
MPAASREPICVVGAGVAGLLATRRLLAEGLAVEVVERRAAAGGLWRRDPRYGGVYHSAHLISSKYSTALPDFPMPADYPDYPGHRQVLDYLDRFTAHHGLLEHVTFGREVTAAVPRDGGGWRCAFDDGREVDYAALVIASGHHWEPACPDVPHDGFDGTVMHAASYDTPEFLAGQRVVVVGLGNTACDIAVDALYAGAEVMLSVRTGNQIIPKYLMGKPVDQLSKGGAEWLTSRLPEGVRTGIEERLIRKLAGTPEAFGLPAPTHRLYARQPVVNSLVPYHIGHGDIRVVPPVTELSGSTVAFTDGTKTQADVVIWGTGYRVSLPFLDVRAQLNGDEQGRPRLWLNMFHPDRDDVVAIGLVDALGSFSTLDVQAQLVARHLRSVLAGDASPLTHGLMPRPFTPALGNGPDREWLFKDRSYTRLLRKLLHQAGGPAR